MKQKKIYKKILTIVFLSLVISTNTNFLNDIYNIYFRNYDERMLRTYGNCGGMSYGFIKKVKEQFLGNGKKLYSVNFYFPTSIGLFSDLSIDENKKNIILIDTKDFDNKKLASLGININEYELIYQENKCFYFKKND
jgi:hypothetical protein|tara:strand:- start:220 stop:630 length:411 start_codon:yes stop_codon:yes gene_type:complete